MEDFVKDGNDTVEALDTAFAHLEVAHISEAHLAHTIITMKEALFLLDMA